MTLQIAFIGTGADPDDPGRDGFAMAYRHANAYRKIDGCELVACADIIPENASAFADTFDVPHIYEDSDRMLREVEPDVVSVCVPPKIHADVVIGAAETGVPRAIHCEKPMAATPAECREMIATAEANGVQLTINHQRRFGAPFRKAKELLDSGAIGDLKRIEFAEENLYDAGIHQFDLCGFFTGGADPEWVLGAVDYREENVWFGAHNENHGFAQWRYDDGTYALASTGDGEAFVGCYMRLRGTDGAIELGVHDGPALRIQRAGSGSWEEIDTDGDIHSPPSPGLLQAAARKVSETIGRSSGPDIGPTYIDNAIADVIEAVRSGGESELNARDAWQATELVFACWESVRRRGRVELPLDVDDNPLEAMVESGALDPAPADADDAAESESNGGGSAEAVQS